MNRPARPARSGEPAAERPPEAQPRLPPPAVTRDEIDLLIRRAGLSLNAGQRADLVVSFQHLVSLAARLPRARPLADEPAFTFHPPLPPLTPTTPGAGAGRDPASPAARTPAKPAQPAKPAKAASPAGRAAPKPARAKPKPTRAKPKPKPQR